MEKTTLGLIAALGVAAATPAMANAPVSATQMIFRPASIAELLDPISNPIEVMKQLRAEQETNAAPVEVADADISIGIPGFHIGHHHHHHHHRAYSYHHHHHHHYRHHHHHHHHHNSY